jgi:hypothetical protein
MLAQAESNRTGRIKAARMGDRLRFGDNQAARLTLS